MLGYMALLESRIWYKSITPTWSDTTTNSVVIAFGVIAVLDRFRGGKYLVQAVLICKIFRLIKSEFQQVHVFLFVFVFLFLFFFKMDV